MLTKKRSTNARLVELTLIKRTPFLTGSCQLERVLTLEIIFLWTLATRFTSSLISKLRKLEIMIKFKNSIMAAKINLKMILRLMTKTLVREFL